MHDPFGLFTTRGPSFVENKGLLHPQKGSTTAAVNFLVLPSCFPVTSTCCSVCSKPSWIFSVSQAEQIPLSFSHLCHFCTQFKRSGSTPSLLNVQLASSRVESNLKLYYIYTILAIILKIEFELDMQISS